jgi:hypothetical protein
MESELPNSTLHYPNAYYGIAKTNPKVCAKNLRYFSLPYRNPNCKPTENGIKKAYNLMRRYYPSYFNQTKILDQWQTVQKYAEKYNFNPLFVIALWIEESAAGGATQSQQLGCLYRLNKNDTFTYLPPSSNICEQMECLFGRKSVVPDNFGLWACQYQHGLRAWQNNTCTQTVTFTEDVDFWYNYIGGENLPNECKTVYYSNCQ